MKTRKRLTAILSDGLQTEITSTLADYSVAILRLLNGNPPRCQLLGSGTVIQRNGKFGILTADHCLHECMPEAQLGRRRGEVFIFVLKRGGVVRINGAELSERRLAVPSSKAFGPDLTFIEIPKARQSAFNAACSYWPMSRSVLRSIKIFGATNTALVAAGFVDANQDIKAGKEGIHHDGLFQGFFANRRVIKRRGKWDYIGIRCNYRKAADLPVTFQGLSGGGIWAVRLKNSVLGGIEILDFCLVGVVFYETPIVKRQRTIRGHFIRSIYKAAWVDA